MKKEEKYSMADVLQKIKKADRTRKSLLDAALRVIGKKGFTSATVDEIVREAGVSKGVAYYHFKSKEDMAASIIEQEFSVLQDDFKEMAASGKDAQDVLLEMLNYFASRLYDHKDLAQFFSTELWRSNRAWSQRLRDSSQKLVDLIAFQITRGQKDGAIRADIDPVFASASIVGMVVIDAVYYLSGKTKPTLSREQFIEHIYDFAHHAIALR